MRVNELLHVKCFILKNHSPRCLSILNMISLEDNTKLKEETTALVNGPLVKAVWCFNSLLLWTQEEDCSINGGDGVRILCSISEIRSQQKFRTFKKKQVGDGIHSYLCLGGHWSQRYMESPRKRVQSTKGRGTMIKDYGLACRLHRRWVVCKESGRVSRKIKTKQC